MEEDNHEDILAVNQVIDNLLFDDLANSPPEVEDPLSIEKYPNYTNYTRINSTTTHHNPSRHMQKCYARNPKREVRLGW